MNAVISEEVIAEEATLENDTETTERLVTAARGVSLFSNCGVGDYGYRLAGFRFDVMADLDSRRLEVAHLNHPEAKRVPGDLRETWREVVAQYREIAGDDPPSLLAACPPCQGMSSANSNRGMADDPDASDDRNLLVTVIANVASELRPDIIVVENVTVFLTRKVRHPETNAPISAAKLLVSSLENDYAAFPILVNLAHYGVPQNRNRTFITFVRRDLDLYRRLIETRSAPYPQPTHDPTNGGLAPIELQDALDEFNLPLLDASTAETASSNIDLHFVPVWDERQYNMVAAIPSSSGASAWGNDTCESCGIVEEVGEDEAVCPRCGDPLPRPIVEKPDGTYRLVKGFRSTSYRRMRPDQPAATITTASGHVGSANTIHPSQNRVFSPLECALLQTIPLEFDWGDALKKWGHTNVRDMIGEAVPPRFTERHGQVLIGLLRGKEGLELLSDEDDRAIKAREKLGLKPPWEALQPELIPDQNEE